VCALLTLSARYLPLPWQAFSELQQTYAEAFASAPAKLPSDFSPTTRSFKMVAECTVTRKQRYMIPSDTA
jgi:hypothetical protein